MNTSDVNNLTQSNNFSQVNSTLNNKEKPVNSHLSIKITSPSSLIANALSYYLNSNSTSSNSSNSQNNLDEFAYCEHQKPQETNLKSYNSTKSSSTKSSTHTSLNDFTSSNDNFALSKNSQFNPSNKTSTVGFYNGTGKYSKTNNSGSSSSGVSNESIANSINSSSNTRNSTSVPSVNFSSISIQSLGYCSSRANESSPSATNCPASSHRPCADSSTDENNLNGVNLSSKNKLVVLTSNKSNYFVFDW